MSKRISTARHRATPEKGATLEAVTQVMGRSGRQAAVIAAASGMVLAVPPAANAAPVQTDRETSTLPATNFKLERTSRSADVISAEPAELNINRADTSSELQDPEPESADLTPMTRETVNESSDEAQGQSTQDQAQSQSQDQGQNETQAETQSASATETQAAPSSTASGSMGGVVSAAYSGVGTPYVWGGKGPGGWDCSGFTAWAYAQAGINIPSSTSAILGSGQFTRTSSPQPGDLVFQNGGSHVGIYVGNGQMIGAQNPSTGTILHNVTRNPLMGYYTYTG